jgi:hypothetical protein
LSSEKTRCKQGQGSKQAKRPHDAILHARARYFLNSLNA